MIHIEWTGELLRHAVSLQTADYPTYEFSSPAGQEMQQVGKGKEINSILIITHYKWLFRSVIPREAHSWIFFI